MYALLIVAAFGWLAFHNSKFREDEFANVSRRVGDRLGKLWDIAHQGMRENRFLRAEKALLTILKIDEKNAAAYNRLGILYAKQKEFRDAIDCFEIASSIEATPSSLHNLGLIYFETENYEKAAIAFEQALKLEDGLAARHVAYAKVQEKLGNAKLMFHELEKAAELEPNKETYTLLHKAYMTHDMQVSPGQAHVASPPGRCLILELLFGRHFGTLTSVIQALPP
jgi:tetratricopeptide (TPR) repeat protein